MVIAIKVKTCMMTQNSHRLTALYHRQGKLRERDFSVGTKQCEGGTGIILSRSREFLIIVLEDEEKGVMHLMCPMKELVTSHYDILFVFFT